MVTMMMSWPEATKEHYESLRTLVDWEGNRPEGAQLHIATFDEKGGIHVTDIWSSAADFQRFADTRLMPAVQQIGVAGAPQIAVHPLHALYAPMYSEAEVG